MFEWRRPIGRLFCLLLSVWMGVGLSRAAAPAMTTITDTVFRADGTPAAGTVIVSWPAFTTADGKPVAAGTKSVTLGTQGALSVSLVPNVGSSPAGSYYTVVFQLGDSVRTECWVVGTTSPIAAVGPLGAEGYLSPWSGRASQHSGRNKGRTGRGYGNHCGGGGLETSSGAVKL